MKLAVIDNENVVNLILADSIEIGEEVTGLACVELPEESFAQVGWLYTNGEFINPNPRVEVIEEPTTVEVTE